MPFTPHGRYKTPEDLMDLFDYHAVDEDQKLGIESIRKAAKVLAVAIVMFVPDGADQAAAIRQLREAVMTANSGIANKGRS